MPLYISMNDVEQSHINLVCVIIIVRFQHSVTHYYWLLIATALRSAPAPEIHVVSVRTSCTSCQACAEAPLFTPEILHRIVRS